MNASPIISVTSYEPKRSVLGTIFYGLIVLGNALVAIMFLNIFSRGTSELLKFYPQVNIWIFLLLGLVALVNAETLFLAMRLKTTNKINRIAGIVLIIDAVIAIFIQTSIESWIFGTVIRCLVAYPFFVPMESKSCRWIRPISLIPITGPMQQV